MFSTRWLMRIARHPRRVVGLWLVASVCGLVASASLNGLLTSPLNVPHTDSSRANDILLRHFGENIEGSFTVITYRPHETPEQIARTEELMASAARRVPHINVVARRAVLGAVFLSITTPFDLRHAVSLTPTLRAALSGHGFPEARITGPAALQYDVTPVLARDLRRGEIVALIASCAILLILLGRRWLSLVPLVIALSVIATVTGVVFLLAHAVPMVLYIPNVVALLALGLTVDFSLLMLQRYRHERHVHDRDVALDATLATAGRTVMISSSIVSLGLSTLSGIDVPFLRALGLAGAFVPLVAGLSAVTLLPAIIRLLPDQEIAQQRADGQWWSRVAQGAIRAPRRRAGIAIVLLLLAASPLLNAHVTSSSTDGLPSHLPAAAALNDVARRFGPGIISPSQLVVDWGRAGVADSQRAQKLTTDLGLSLLRDREVFTVAVGEHPPFRDRSGRYSQVLIFGRHAFSSAESAQLVERLRDTIIPHSSLGHTATTYLGGASAQSVDFVHSVYGSLWWIALLVVLLAGFLLWRAFASPLLMVMSLFLNALSVMAALGLMTLLTTSRITTALLGTYQMDALDGWVPVFVIAVLFGLSMDYQVFVISRVSEIRRLGAPTHDAIVSGFSSTGRVITGAALILSAAMSGFVIGHIAGLQEMGLGLGLGVLVDVTVVRALALPSLLALGGDRVWGSDSRP